MSNNSSNKAWSRSSDVDQRFVATPYGKGIVIATSKRRRNNYNSIGDEHAATRNDVLAAIDCTRRNKDDVIVMQVVELLDWALSSSNINKFPKLYSTAYLPSVRPMIGDDVICTYGRGTVLKLPSKDGDQKNHLVVHIKSWRLQGDSNKNKVLCYLLPHQVYVVRKKTLHEMDVYERVENANKCKQEANASFANQQYKQALTKYEKAVDSVRYVQHDADSNNYVRADLVEIMITCSNNAATSCVKLVSLDPQQQQGIDKEHVNYYKEMIQTYAKNALLLIDALNEKRGQKIHTILSKKYSDEKIFGEWRIKSLLLLAKFHVEKKEYSESIPICKQIKQVLEEFASPNNNDGAAGAILARQEKEMQRLLATSMKQLKIEKLKEKQRAQAMFGSPTTKTKKKSNLRGEKELNASNGIDRQDFTTATPRITNKKISNGTSKLSSPYDNSTKSSSTKKTTASTKTRVSFHEHVEVDNEKDSSFQNIPTTAVDDEEEEESWFGNNKEALIIGAAASFLAVTCMLLFRSRGK